MPTYDFRCAECGERQSVFLPIGEYCRTPPAFICCERPMERFFALEGGNAIANALAGDRHYDGMRTLDGVDVSTRTKHREYMKQRGLTTMDDYRSEWRKAAEDRAKAVEGVDPSRRRDVVEAIERIKAR